MSARRLVVLAILSISGIGCAHRARPAGTSKVFDAQIAARWSTSRFAVERAVDPRKPGDFAVFKVSGMLLDEPRTISERVVAREGAIVVVDYDLTSTSGGHETLRVSFDAVRAFDDGVFAVSRLSLGAEQPMEVAAFESFMNATMLTSDVVDHGEVFRTPTFVREVDGRSFDCEESSARVTVRGVGATRTSTICADLAWGEVESEIVDDDGDVLHHAELVELGESDPHRPIYVAKGAPRWLY